MNKLRHIPAGLLDNNIEFFSDPNNQEICYCLTGGRVYKINEAPLEIRVMIDTDIAAHPEKVEALVALGYETDEDLRQKYCSCCFGSFDGEADVKDGVFIHNEYNPCPLRGNCSAEGILCNSLMVGDNKYLSKREVQVLTLIGKCLLNKEIAGELQISEETVKIHVKHIQEKAGLMNSKDLVKLAIKKNLI